MGIYVVLGFSVVLWFGAQYIARARMVSRELGRCRAVSVDALQGATDHFDGVAESFAEKMRGKRDKGKKDEPSEMEQKLLEAGLESAAAQGKFLIFRVVCFIAGPFIGSLAYVYMIPYYATLCLLVSSAAGILVPMLWLKGKTMRRLEDIQRELPLVLDLTNLATSAGWDIASALEQVVDALAPEFPKHPLVREFKKARWLAASGYTWDESLQKISERLGDDTVKRTTLALGQAIRQGGDRTSQLEGIAQDAHRIYYSELDKRLAGLQVKGLLITMMLFLAYLLMLLAPAFVSMKSSLGK